MPIKKSFSIIELMTVILVILLLISLTIPVFVNLKINARSAICKSQLRQLGVLITDYTSDNGGYLPNDDGSNRTSSWLPRVYSDLGWSNPNNNGFYQYWNGHLLPYLDFKIPQRYTRAVNGNVVTVAGNSRAEIQAVPTPAQGVFKDGWVVLDDALNNGGYQDLKLFICPEIHASAFDVGGIKIYNGLKVPRIGLLMYKYGLTGTPTTYLANSVYFGKNGYYDAKVDSKRIDEISDLSEKVLLVEGGQAFPDDYSLTPYFFPNNNYYVSNSGGLIANFDIGDEANHKLSFAHDSHQEFWIKGGKTNNFFAHDSFGKYTELANKFNAQFAGKAMMVAGAGTSSGWAMLWSIVSFVDPENGKVFEPFFKANSGLSSIGGWVSFVNGQENDYHALVGNMNVLFGDNSVATKNNAWLCNSRMKISGSAY
jgi:type II secretory pathway pseudopilin PulG